MYLSIYPIYLFYLSINLPFFLTTSLPPSLPTYLPIHLSIYVSYLSLSIYLPIYRSIYPTYLFYRSTYLSINQAIHLSTYLYVYVHVYTYVHTHLYICIPHNCMEPFRSTGILEQIRGEMEAPARRIVLWGSGLGISGMRHRGFDYTLKALRPGPQRYVE